MHCSNKVGNIKKKKKYTADGVGLWSQCPHPNYRLDTTLTELCQWHECTHVRT